MPFSSCSRIILSIFSQHNSARRIGGSCSFAVRTDGSGLNHVADGESLDGLVLGSAAGAVGAAHGLDVAAAVLVATAVKLLVYLILSLLC
jgi:hypothetical protein